MRKKLSNSLSGLPMAFQICGQQGCGRETWSGTSSCALHQRGILVPLRDFELVFDPLVEEWIGKRHTSWNLDFVSFPSKFEFSKYKLPRNVSLRSAFFRGRADFSDHTFGTLDLSSAEFRDGLFFENVMFQCGICTIGISVSSMLAFRSCVIEDESHASKMSVGMLSLRDCTFKEDADFEDCSVQSLSISRCKFEKAVALSNLQNYGTLFVERSNFEDVLQLDKCWISDSASFRDSAIVGSFYCPESKFGSELHFSNVHLPRTIHLSYSVFAVNCIFYNCNVGNSVRLFWPGDGKPRSSTGDSNAAPSRGTL